MKKISKLSLENILKKFIGGSYTGADKKQLFDVILDSDNEGLLKDLLFDQLNELEDDQVMLDNSIDTDRVYGTILETIRQNQLIEAELEKFEVVSKRRRLLLYGASVAAIFIFAFLLGNFFNIFGNKAYSLPTVEYSYNEIKAPLGSKSEIKLSDGTIVMLNAGSTLRYRNDYNSSNRDLTLVGEALFTVARNIDIPLNVSAGNIVIKAIGTKFNVKAYEEEGIIETTLIEGKVEITQAGENEEDGQYLDLTPNQKAIYMKESDNFTLEEIKPSDSLEVAPIKSVYENILIAPKVDISEVVAWTQGKLIIRGQNLDDLCVDLHRKYNVSFIFKTEDIKKYRFSGILLDETLEQVLNVIKLTAPIDYYLEGKNVYLSSNSDELDNYSKHLK